MHDRRLAYFAAAFALAVMTTGGCGRTPPSSVGKKEPSAASVRVRQPGLGAVHDAIRDDSVQPAAFQAPIRAPKNEQQLAADALSRIGPPAVPMLAEALRSSDVQVRRQACEVLLRMGPDAKGAVPDLVRLLDDEDQELRKMAAKALGRIGPDAADAVPALMRTMLEGESLPPPSDSLSPVP